MAGKKAKRAQMRNRKQRARNRSLRLETLEQRQLLAADVMHNIIRPADINDDGQVNTVDALMAIDRFRTGRGPQQGNAFFDVNADGRFNVADPLSAIDSLRRARHGPRDPQETEVRSVSGEGNNELNSEWGQVGEAYVRLVESDYADGLSEPLDDDRPSAREVSNVVFSQEELTENEEGLSDLFWQWGQFLDHDLDLTESADPEQAYNIEVPAGDAWFDPFNSGEAEISLSRSLYDDANGLENAREQINSISAYIDGSNIYGSDAERAAELRTFEGGRLKTSEGDLLPFNEAGLDNAGGTSETLFLAGDVRANEQVGLTAMHTIWMREHNRIAGRIVAENDDLSDEEIFQRARTMVIAELQAITYNEFLPALLGENALDRYAGYDENVNPGISNIFATAAYRFGHSMLSPELLRLDENGEVAEEGNLSLREAFFSPDEITEYGVDTILRGMAANTAQEIDAQVIDDVRNFLFGPPGAGGFDLAALNIQRGRDHGLPDYNDVREQLGLGRVESFAEITSDAETQASLEEVYGDVDSIDVWVGMLAEDHADGAAIGATAGAVLVDQFERLRDGDRFWYQRVLGGEQLRQVERTSLADVIERNSGVEDLQRNVFFSPDSQPEHPPAGGKGPPPPSQPGGQQHPGRAQVGANGGANGEPRGRQNQGPGGPENQRPGQRPERGGPEQGGPEQGGPERGGPERRDSPPSLLVGQDSLLDELLLPPFNAAKVDSVFGEDDV